MKQKTLIDLVHHRREGHDETTAVSAGTMKEESPGFNFGFNALPIKQKSGVDS